ncbi:MAG: RHS repeat protein [Planctomycetes bacterium]|nr:RHS repeat protein [Planctomycetota bacterium]
MRIGGQTLSLTYDTRTKLPGAAWLVSPPASFGPLWQSNLHKSVQLQSSAGPGSAYSSVALQRGGSWSTAGVSGFESCGGGGGGEGSMSYVPTTERSQRITFSGGAAQVIDGKALTYEQYDATGAALSVQRASGERLTYTYSDASTPASTAPIPGLLIGVQDLHGRSIQFTYEQPADNKLAPHIRSITGPDGQSITADYDTAGNLIRLTWPDQSARVFLYERADLPWALTGIEDENQRRHATYAYDSAGRAISTEKAGGVERYAVSYAAGGGPAWSVTETVIGDLICREHRWQAPSGTVLSLPNGQTNSLSATTTKGMVGLTGQSQPAGSGCSASASGQDYDANGNVSQLDDFNGQRSCYAYDLNRNLRTTTVQGLANSTSCSSVISPNATLPADSRKTSTSWHPDWNLAIRQAEPGRITTSIYNGQPDPFNGNAVASCAPATALLPDGKPIAVLCKRVEQATTDTDGHLGFSATLQPGVPDRTTTWTYNQYGQVLTENGPRTDVNDITTYAYYSDTSFTGEGAAAQGHYMGDLQSVTNAAGKVTQYSLYNKHGQVLESVDPNGVVTTNTYDLRQRLLSTTIGGQTTTYQYDLVGQLKKVTLPDQSWIGYDYDDAHRQVAVYDNRGNRTDYTLDNAGNRTGETTKDPSGALKRQLSRSIDALGRVQQTTGRGTRL